MNETDYILMEQKGAVAVIKLNRLDAKNMLNLAMLRRLNQALKLAEENGDIRVIVLTSAGRSFCEGADIDEIDDIGSAEEARTRDYLTGDWEYISTLSKPIIAAVAGFAVGGGCELAMMCDIIVVADNARFGQPEVGIGLIPGGGATQRLPRMVGKFKAMELCLTGNFINAKEAQRIGLVNTVVDSADLLKSALNLAHAIARHSLPAIQAVKETIKLADEVPLSDGLRKERHRFHTAFDWYDKKEGINALKTKRTPKFEHR